MKLNWRLSLLARFGIAVWMCAAAAGGCSPQPVIVNPAGSHDAATAPHEIVPPANAPTRPIESTDGDRGARKVDVQVGGPGGVNVQVGPKTDGASETSTAK